MKIELGKLKKMIREAHWSDRLSEKSERWLRSKLRQLEKKLDALDDKRHDMFLRGEPVDGIKSRISDLEAIIRDIYDELKERSGIEASQPALEDDDGVDSGFARGMAGGK